MSTEPPSPSPAVHPASPADPSDAAAGAAGGAAATGAAGEGPDLAATAVRDIADVAAVEVVTTAAVHLMSAAAVKCGLAEDAEAQGHRDLGEARVLITALAGLVTAAAPEIGNQHARALRDGLRSLQLAFAEALPYPDPVGQGPGERLTGRVSRPV